MKRLRFCLLLLCCALHLAAAAANFDETYDFANHLQRQGEFYRAITEYERCRFLFPTEPRAETALSQIINCHIKLGQYQKAAQNCELYLDAYPQSAERPAVLLKMAQSYAELGKYSEGAGELQYYLTSHPQEPLRAEFLKLIGLCYLKAAKWSEAQEAFQQLAVWPDTPWREAARTAGTELAKTNKIPRRSPFASGLMSAVLPGTGQIYCGRVADGVAAFSVNAFFTYATVVAFQEKQPVVGGLLSIIELGWYSGNIYSAVNSAHKYNQQQEKTFIRKISDNFTPQLSWGGKGRYGISFAFTF